MPIQLIIMMNVVAIVAIFFSNFFIPQEKIRQYTINKLAVMLAVDIILLLI